MIGNKGICARGSTSTKQTYITPSFRPTLFQRTFARLHGELSQYNVQPIYFKLSWQYFEKVKRIEERQQ